jgi:hypothetical protein
VINHSQFIVNHVTSAGEWTVREAVLMSDFRWLYCLIDPLRALTVGINELYKEAIHQAGYNSSARDPPPRCPSRTRDQEIDQILSWESSSLGDNPPPLLWANGVAGVGKSALAQTCVENLKAMDVPLASFFFSKKHGWNDHKRFFPTIAYQLSTQFPEYRALLDAAICRDRSLLLDKGMASQFEELILGPFRELQRARRGIGRRIPIFVDALDECDDIAAQSRIIEVVAAAGDGADFFCWAFFTRPEPHIKETFSRPDIDVLNRTIILSPLPALNPEAAHSKGLAIPRSEVILSKATHSSADTPSHERLSASSTLANVSLPANLIDGGDTKLSSPCSSLSDPPRYYPLPSPYFICHNANPKIHRNTLEVLNVNQALPSNKFERLFPQYLAMPVFTKRFFFGLSSAPSRGFFLLDGQLPLS